MLRACLFALLLAAGCGRAPRPAAEPEELRLDGPGAESYAEPGEPEELSRLVEARAKKLLGKTVPADPALEAAARRLAGFVLPGCGAWPLWLEEPILHHAGWMSPGIHALVVCSGPRGRRAFLRAADGTLKRQRRATHLAAVRVSRGWLGSTYVLLLGESRLRLKPFPRRVAPGESRRLAFRLDPGMSEPRVYHLTPDGRVDQLPVLAEDAPGEFSAEFAPKEAARHWLEIMGSGPEGPEVLALFPVDAGIDAPSVIRRLELPKLEVSGVEEAEGVLLALVNRERERRGIPAVRADERLARIARVYSRWQARQGRIAHRTLDGSGPAERAAAAGYPALMLAENLSKEVGVLEAHLALMASPAHRAALLDARYTHLGVGVATEEKGGKRYYYVTEEFAVPQEPLSAGEVRAAVGESIRAHRLRGFLPGAFGDARLEAAAQDLLGAPDMKAALDAAMGSRGIAGTAFATRQTLVDPADFVLPQALTLAGELRYGLAARERRGERALRAYELALIVLVPPK